MTSKIEKYRRVSKKLFRCIWLLHNAEADVFVVEQQLLDEPENPERLKKVLSVLKPRVATLNRIKNDIELERALAYNDLPKNKANRNLKI